MGRGGIAAMALWLALGVAAAARAQEEDAENCKNHPMFSRMSNFIIQGCENNFDAVEFYLPKDETRTLEGQKSTIQYGIREGIAIPSPLQIRRNYGNAAKSLGGSVLFDQDTNLTARVGRDGKEVWLKIEVFNNGHNYTLTVLELGEMKQEVTARDILDALDKAGFIALYINFDTGKADVLVESLPIVDEIVTLLKENPDLNVSLEGHTDNTGSPQGNKILSEQRAASVMSLAVKAGVAASRLRAVGWGPERPIADNRREEGRAKNRRVEIVKK
jgi:outer membrane protein OmpA-like peptidoglycan-associated protein